MQSAIDTGQQQPCDRQWLLENAKGASGILCMLNDKCDKELIEVAGDKLKVVSSYSAGCEFERVAQFADSDVVRQSTMLTWKA